VASAASSSSCTDRNRAHHDPIWQACPETITGITETIPSTPSTPSTTLGDIAEPRALFDLDLCQALLAGYAELAAPLFNPETIALLYPAIRLIPLELAIRFLTDYLEGDRYFRVTHARQNLEKTLIQLDLVRDIEAKQPQIEAMIHHSFNRRSP
jgi:hypothetical protein